MAVNPLIALAARTPEITNFSDERIKAQQAQDAQQLNQEKLAQERISTLSARDKSRLESSILGAVQLDPYLQSGNIDGAKNFLLQRKKELGQRIANGENVDTRETDDALSMLESGDIDSLKSITGQAGKLGQLTGIFKNPNGDKPALLQTLDAYKNASAEDKAILRTFAKVDEKGLTYDPETGGVTNTPGATDAVKNLSYSKKRGGQDAIADTIGDIERRKAGGQPLPANIAQQQDTLLEEIQLGTDIVNDTSAFVDKIDTGELNLNVLGNIADKLKNKVSVSDAESQQFSSFQAYLEKLRNDSLRLNKGVQTEGDAQRAWNELLANINDPAVVRKRLTEIAGYNNRAISSKGKRIQTLRKEYYKEPLDIEGNIEQGSPYDSYSSASENVSNGDSPALSDQRIRRQAANSYIDSLPQGAKQIGKSGGKPVYQTPDGRTFIQD